MPTITDWLMVVITLIYVVATIFICLANFKSAKVSKEELAEMKRQYAEENRPRIEIEFIYEHRMWFIVRFINHGNLTAQHVRIELDEEFIKSLPEQTVAELLLKQNYKEIIIGVGQHYDLYIGSNALRGNPNMKPIIGKITYQDEKRSYKSDIFIDLENYATFFSSTYDDPMVLELRNIKGELKEIKNSISACDDTIKKRTQTYKRVRIRKGKNK